MRRRISVLVGVIVLVLAAGLVLAAIARVREAAGRIQCKNNLKGIGIALMGVYGANGSFPPATTPNDRLLPEQRLSWLVDLIPYMDQVVLVIDRTTAWDATENRVPKFRFRDGDWQDGDDHYKEAPCGEIKMFRCPANHSMADPDSPGLTHYVGMAGLGKDSADLTLLDYPGVGVFGYDRRTRREDIKDGAGCTMMVVETNLANGPWTAGGFATVRGVDTSDGNYLGATGQFDSGHRNVTNVLFADGSVRGLTRAISPDVFEALSTIAGGEETGPVGE